MRIPYRKHNYLLVTIIIYVTKVVDKIESKLLLIFRVLNNQLKTVNNNVQYNSRPRR